MIAFTVPGNPIPKARARVVNGHAFTPKTTAAWESKVRTAYTGPVHAGPLKVALHFRRADARACDWDNLAKAVTDALNGVAWHDDKQIVAAVVTKFIDRANPGVDVEISHVD